MFESSKDVPGPGMENVVDFSAYSARRYLVSLGVVDTSGNFLVGDTEPPINPDWRSHYRRSQFHIIQGMVECSQEDLLQ